jgi:predicted RNA-binding protein (virulence factor B family)
MRDSWLLKGTGTVYPLYAYLCPLMQIGQYHTLEILRDTPPGLFLGDAEGHEVLLPNKYVPRNLAIGDKLEVFVYLDHEERLIATTIRPYITLHGFAVLEVTDVSKVGAFLDWGLEKDLFVPFREQLHKMKPGRSYLVFMYEDESTGRLLASQKIRRFLDNEVLTVNEGDEVDLIIGDPTDLGINVIVNSRHLGLVYRDEVFSKLSLGDHVKGYVKMVRDDHKLDISLQKAGYENIEPNAQKILDLLKGQQGFMTLSDNSDPEEIKDKLGMSKKTFKKALGLLYRQKLVTLHEDGVRLVSK